MVLTLWASLIVTTRHRSSNSMAKQTSMMMLQPCSIQPHIDDWPPGSRQHWEATILSVIATSFSVRTGAHISNSILFLDLGPLDCNNFIMRSMVHSEVEIQRSSSQTRLSHQSWLGEKNQHKRELRLHYTYQCTCAQLFIICMCEHS